MSLLFHFLGGVKEDVINKTWFRLNVFFFVVFVFTVIVSNEVMKDAFKIVRPVRVIAS